MGEAKRRRSMKGSTPAQIRALRDQVDALDAPPAEQAEVEKVSPEDLTYWVRCINAVGEIQNIDAQLEALAQRRLAILGAHDSYGSFLAEKYGLDMARDSVETDGTIVRAQKA